MSSLSIFHVSQHCSSFEEFHIKGLWYEARKICLNGFKVFLSLLYALLLMNLFPRKILLNALYESITFFKSKIYSSNESFRTFLTKFSLFVFLIGIVSSRKDWKRIVLPANKIPCNLLPYYLICKNVNKKNTNEIKFLRMILRFHWKF